MTEELDFIGQLEDLWVGHVLPIVDVIILAILVFCKAVLKIISFVGGAITQTKIFLIVISSFFSAILIKLELFHSLVYSVIITRFNIYSRTRGVHDNLHFIIFEGPSDLINF